MYKYLKPLCIGLILVVSFFFLKMVISYFAADYLASSAKDALYKGQISDSLLLINNALDLNTNEPNYHKLRATILLTATLSEQFDSEQKTALREEAASELDNAYSLEPTNVVNIKNLLPIYAFTALKDVSNTSNPQVDVAFKERAMRFYAKVQDIIPTDPSFYLLLGKQYKLLGENQKASEMFTQALRLKPDLEEARSLLNII